MSELQEKIDEILKKRKTGVEKLLEQQKVIADLKNAVYDIKKKVKEVNLDNTELYIPRLDDAEKKLSDASQKLDHLKNRFDRETINLGVAGVTHAGKSTLLQAISGLDNEVLPRAVKGDNYAEPTTATRSQIYNGLKGAEIEFRSEGEFLEFVNEYGEKIESVAIPKFYSINDFGKFDFASVENQIKIGKETSNYKRIRGIQEALPFFKSYLTGKTQPISGNHFDELKNFVKYSYTNAENRLYPAVKNIKIRNTFCGIDPELKLGLIDLPGFGENDNVDKIMIKGLENDVDFAILLIRPSNTDAGLLEKGISNFDRINEVQKGISKRSNFLSILINKDYTLGDLLDDCVSSAKKSINEYYNRNGESFTTYEFSLESNGKINQEDVSKMLNSILGNLINILPQMDEDLLDNFRKTLDISDIKALLEEIYRMVENNAYESADENIFPTKGDLLKEKFRDSLDALIKSDTYKCSEDIDDSDFAELVRKMKVDIKNEISSTLLYVPNERYSDWSVYADKTANSNPFGWPGLQSMECHRLWVEIIKRYEKIDEYFKTKMENFKADIIEALRKNTENLISGEGSEALSNLIVMMEKVGLTDNMIYNALKYLEPIRQDFRQNVYPFLLRDNVHKTLSMESDGYAKFGESQKGNELKDTKSQLQGFAINANKQIADTIINYNVFNFYLFGTLENFNELILYSKNAFNSNEDYRKFCSRFRMQLYPQEYGQESDNVKMQELKTYLNNAINLINKI